MKRLLTIVLLIIGSLSFSDTYNVQTVLDETVRVYNVNDAEWFYVAENANFGNKLLDDFDERGWSINKHETMDLDKDRGFISYITVLSFNPNEHYEIRSVLITNHYRADYYIISWKE